MYVVTAITGQVGGTVAEVLLQAGKSVRGISRKPTPEFTARGVEICVGDMHDAIFLTEAFSDAEAVFILLPPNFYPSPGFPESRQIIAAIKTALLKAKPKRVVCLSTVGAHAKQENLLTQLQILESELSELPLPITFLRAAWFIENSAWDIPAAKAAGIIYSFLQPADHAIPMVSVVDVGRTAAELMQKNFSGKAIAELEGTILVSPRNLAQTFSELLNKHIDVSIVERDQWQELFMSQGMNNPLPPFPRLY